MNIFLTKLCLIGARRTDVLWMSREYLEYGRRQLGTRGLRQ